MSDLISRQEFTPVLCVTGGDGYEEGKVYPMMGWNNGVHILRVDEFGDVIDREFCTGGYGKGLFNCFIGWGYPSFDELPTADVVEVVRCRDCKFYTFKPQQTSRTTSVRRCNRSAIICTKPDDYCSFGERTDT